MMELAKQDQHFAGKVQKLEAAKVDCQCYPWLEYSRQAGGSVTKTVSKTVD